jgi:hypothetical protein
MNPDFYSFTQLAIDRIKESLLFAASQGGNLHDIESLLEIGADIDWISSSGDTSLTVACRKGYKDIIKLLISYGANVNKAAEDSLTALHIVTMNRDINCIKLILSASPVMSIRTIDGLSAYDIARMKGFDDIFSKLVQETVPYDQSYRTSVPDAPPLSSTRNKSNSSLIAITPRAESVYLSPLNNNLINRSTSALSSGQSLSSLQKNREASQSLIGDDTIVSSQSVIQSMRSSVESESYTIVGPDSLQQHHDATIGLQKVYEKELKDRKATELKVSSMPMYL